MRITMLSLIARATAVAIAPVLMLPGCDDGVGPVVHESWPHASTTANTESAASSDNKCIMDILYLVEGDTFTFMSGGSQTIEPRGHGQSPYGWRPDIEPRAKIKLDLDGYEGAALLLWDDVVVETFEIDRAFLMSDEVAILAHDDPDGTRVEFHVYAQSRCSWPDAVSTRAEIVALER